MAKIVQIAIFVILVTFAVTSMVRGTISIRGYGNVTHTNDPWMSWLYVLLTVIIGGAAITYIVSSR